MPRFAALLIDVDSTLTGIEGIDWLALRRGDAVAREVAGLTDRAMRGEIPLDRVYGERLALVRPRRDDVEALVGAYRGAAAPGAGDALARLARSGVRVAVLSGGVRQAVAPFAGSLGVDDAAVHAVPLRFDAAGDYVDFDHTSPLATQEGKALVAGQLLAGPGAFPRPALAVGDGATDLAMRGAVDAFAAFTGFVRREPVVRAADHSVASFTQLVELVLG
ncbi:MAG TPA: HAD-IB family phosphatase [Gemmatimonadaceae bacterium]|nr:HAD-IB family phosphatase [Gemmatimonadaceae bacterium]